MSAFTPEEISIIRHIANAPHSAIDRIASHASYLLPGIVISAYGIYAENILAVATGAASILIYQFIQIYREAKYTKLYKSIFAKVDAIDRNTHGDTA